MKTISQLNTAKTCQNADTSTKIIKLNKAIFAKFISNNFKNSRCIDEDEFPCELKHADVIPVHKKKDKCVKIPTSKHINKHLQGIRKINV